MHMFKRAIAITVVLGASVLFVFVLSRAVWGDDSGVTAPEAVAHTVATSSLPVQLRIPSLSIDARVQYVGATPTGNIGIPSNFRDVAWYKEGIVPGQLGTAIIDGHVDNGLALPGVFKKLSSVKVGDSLYIETRDGQQLHFVVYDTRVYPYESVPMQEIIQNTNAPRIVLITCDGAWVQKNKTYSERLVVYAALATG